jgi:hypothetical protein
MIEMTYSKDFAHEWIEAFSGVQNWKANKDVFKEVHP